MAKEDKAAAPSGAAQPPVPELFEIKIIAPDSVWSSVGRHEKGDVVKVPKADAVVLIEKELAVAYAPPPTA